MNLIQLLTDQQAYEGITHSRWGASWNWRWRWVGDDEEWRSPSPEPQMDSRSALPRKNRAWRRLCLVERDNSFSLIFLEICDFIVLGGSSAGPPGGYNPPGRARRGGHALVGCAQLVAPLWWVLAPEILIIGIKNPRKVSSISRTFISAQKQHHGSSAENSVSLGLVSFKSCKLESKTRGNVLGKVDTLETYQLPQA